MVWLAVLMLASILMVIIAMAIVTAHDYDGCQEMGTIPVQDLPKRCARYWGRH